MIGDLEQEVAEFVLQIFEIASCDRVGDLIGLLDDGVGDQFELLEVSPAAGHEHAELNAI